MGLVWAGPELWFQVSLFPAIGASPIGEDLILFADVPGGEVPEEGEDEDWLLEGEDSGAGLFTADEEEDADAVLPLTLPDSVLLLLQAAAAAAAAAIVW